MNRSARFLLVVVWLVAALACSLIPFRLGAAPLPPAEQTATAIWATPGCDLERLEYHIAWQLNDDLAGTLQMTNPSPQVCRLNGSPTLALEDSGGQPLLVDLHPSTPDAPAFVLPPGGAATSAFSWSNWCGSPPLGSLFIRLTLSGYGGSFTLPLEDPNGLPLSATPACTDSTSPSRLLVEPLQAAPG